MSASEAINLNTSDLVPDARLGTYIIAEVWDEAVAHAMRRNGKRKQRIRRMLKLVCDCGATRTTRVDHLIASFKKSSGYYCAECTEKPKQTRRQQKMWQHIGTVFGVYEVTGAETAEGIPCRCTKCGTDSVVKPRQLTSSRRWGASCPSCLSRKHNTTSPYVFAHKSMIARCHDPESRDYYNYGARGIHVHPEWHDFAVFKQWLDDNLGPRPKDHTLDRIDPDGHYEPGNVRWADHTVQRLNQRRTRSRAAVVNQRLKRLGLDDMCRPLAKPED